MIMVGKRPLPLVTQESILATKYSANLVWAFPGSLLLTLFNNKNTPVPNSVVTSVTPVTLDDYEDRDETADEGYPPP